LIEVIGVRANIHS